MPEGLETTLGLRAISEAVVITTGTFMRGLLHVGLAESGGRPNGGQRLYAERSLRALGFEVGRFKTGTPCRFKVPH